MSLAAALLEQPASVGRAWLAQSDLLLFTRRMFPQYQIAGHHKQLGLALQAVEAGACDRLIITMPPRHGKSELASVHFPSWFLGRNPHKRIIAASHSSMLAFHFSRRARNLMSDPAWPFPVTTAGDLATVQAWDIAGHRGGYYASGVGGRIAGRGADLLLIDDAVGSAEEADSENYRESTWEWFTQDAMTRLEPGGRIVLIGTRWHEDDLIGRVLERQAGQWTHINLPAIDDDGQALWPARFPLEKLEQRRAEIGTRAFTALYQQRPSPVEGAILKREWWMHWRHPLPRMDWLLQSWDTAFKKGRDNDYSACITIGLGGSKLYLLDLWREKVEFPALKRAVRDQFTKWQPDEILVEDAASGQSLLQELGPDADPDLYIPLPSLPLVPFTPDRDKLARVHAISPYAEGGRLFLPVDAPWVEPFVEEAAVFPGGVHDDQVDALSMGVLRMASRLGMLRPMDPILVAAFADLPRS